MRSWSIGRMARYVTQCKYLEQLKQNDDLCSQAFQTGKFLMFSDGKPLLTFGGPPPGVSITFTSYKETVPFCGEDFTTRAALLGIEEDSEDNTALFACPTSIDVSADDFPQGSKFTEMRTACLSLFPKEAGTVSRGYSLLNWLGRMKYCSTCASPLKRKVAGTMLTCNSCSKGNHHYPVTHPVAITRIEDPTGQKVLLARNRQHPSGIYSCVAGFLEAGESLEEAVRREVAEEVGIVVGEVKFFGSQTWPLPQNTLMLGCTTQAMDNSTTLDIDKSELDDAKWFTKEEVTQAYHRIVNNPKLLIKNTGDALLIPPRGPIAHDLLKDWIGL